ncbi:MAG: FAD-dependent oxidoreductase, partial [Gemmatimonadetes bacterium]|nr:FAD-dependent oxidoreductase [Gemmatimonadota bacterium]
MTDHDDKMITPAANESGKPSRREFLKGTLAGAATVSLGAPSEVAAEHEPSSETQLAPEEFDVAIVGGGVAGCYVAYRLLHGDFDPNSALGKLKQANNGLKVGLFEYSGRVGGRLTSARIPLPNNPDKGIGEGSDEPRQYAEFGGFRFQPQMHIVRDLAALLGLEDEPFPVDEPGENPVYVRGTRLTQQTIGGVENTPPTQPPTYNISMLPYHFTAAEETVLENGTDFTTYVANQAFKEHLPDDTDSPDHPATPNGYFTLRKRYHAAFQVSHWSEVKTLRDMYERAKQQVVVDGRPLVEWSWWALMSRFLSPEAIAYVEDTGGYNSRWAPGNVSSNLREDFYFATAGDIYNGDSHPTEPKDTAWKHITTGYSDIPNKLYERFLKAGGSGRLNHQLVRFDKAAGGGYELLFFRRESGTTTSGQAEYQINLDAKKGRLVSAKFLVLAIPKRALELLDRSTFFLRDVKVNNLLDTVLNDPAIRIFMAYETPWWRVQTTIQPTPTNPNPPPPLTRGRSTTDLQVRQFYYWLTAPASAANQASFLLASYSNGQAERYWRSLEGGPAYDDSKGSVAQAGRNDGPQGIGPRAAAETMAKLAHEQIMQVVGVTDAPEPYYAHFQNWTKEPWGAGWHAFTAGS